MRAGALTAHTMWRRVAERTHLLPLHVATRPVTMAEKLWPVHHEYAKVEDDKATKRFYTAFDRHQARDWLEELLKPQRSEPDPDQEPGLRDRSARAEKYREQRRAWQEEYDTQQLALAIVPTERNAGEVVTQKWSVAYLARKLQNRRERNLERYREAQDSSDLAERIVREMKRGEYERMLPPDVQEVFAENLPDVLPSFKPTTYGMMLIMTLSAITSGVGYLPHLFHFGGSHPEDSWIVSVIVFTNVVCITLLMFAGMVEPLRPTYALYSSDEPCFPFAARDMSVYPSKPASIRFNGCGRSASHPLPLVRCRAC